VTTDESDRGLASERHVVLIADRGPEADPIGEALRRADLAVVTCDVVALPERVTRIDPIAMVVDTEQPHAEAVLERLVAQEGPRNLPAMALIGAPERGPKLGLVIGTRVRWWTRPLEPSEVVAFLLERVSRALGERTDIPSSVGSMPLGSESDAMLVSDFPALAGLPEVESILPELTHGGPGSTRAGSLSPEIEAMLEGAAQRMNEHPGEPADVGEEPRVVVPAEMMATVDDLLAGEEESPATRGGASLAQVLDATVALDDGRDIPTASEIPMSPRHGGWESPGTGGHDARTQAQEHKTTVKVGSDTFFRVEGSPRFSSPGELGGEGPRSTRRGDPSWSDVADEMLSGTLSEDSAEPGASVASDAPVGLRSAPGGPRPPVPYPRSPSAPPAAESSLGALGLQVMGTGADAMGGGVPAHADDGRSSRPGKARTAVGSAAGSIARAGSPPTRPGRSEPPPLTTLGGPLPSEGVEPDSSRIEEGDPYVMLARAVRGRATGAMAFDDGDGRWPRRILLREGDLTNAASDEVEDGLLRYLVSRGDLAPEVARAGPKLPRSGRHAAAALIARGILEQDELWPTLRAHAEWLVARVLQAGPTAARLESAPPERLRAEPNVFGGAAGAEIYVDAVRRVLAPEEALQRLGGLAVRLKSGPRLELMVETALDEGETAAIRAADGMAVGDMLAVQGPGFGSLLYALVCLDVLELDALPARRGPEVPEASFDPLDADAVRHRVEARLALVREADYFTLLGVTQRATPYEIRRAYLQLRRAFDPSRLMTPATADLADDVQLIVDVLEEAFEVLREPHRRRRYQRALEAAASRA